LTVILGLFLSFSAVNAKNFSIFNATTPSQSYFTVNGTSGNVGIGMTNPSSLLQLLNNGWISAKNNAGTGVVNMFKVNASDQIEVGAPLNIGSFEFSPDSGLVSFVDMPVTSAVASGTPEGYAFKIDGDNIMTAYSESNGTGGVQNKRLGIGLTNPTVALDVAGTFRNTLATTHSLLGGAGNVLVMADNTGALYTTSTASFAGGAGLWGGTKNANIWNGDAGVGNVGIGLTNPASLLTIGAYNTAASTSKQSLLSVDNMQLSQLEGGAYFGRVGLKENQLGLSNYGATWTAKGNVTTYKDIAMSSDGKVQTAVTDGNYIYVSNDYGATWTQTGSSQLWESVAMSSDGKIQTAVVWGGYIYISTNYGATWTTKDSTRNWNGVDMSADGKIQTAVSYYGGYIYVSYDYGNTWAQKGITNTYTNVAMSSDGKVQAAAVGGDGGLFPLYVSYDYGNTWTATDIAHDRTDVAMSADGKIQTTVIGDTEWGYIRVSYDYGATWATKGNSLGYSGIAMSADGKIQTATAGNIWAGGSDYIYVSTDYGNTWTQRGSSQTWWRVAMSADGKIQTAGAHNNYIYVSYADSYVSGNGNFGIGTTNPSDKLSVYTTKTGTPTATPDSISLGATFSSVAGTNLKIKLYDSGTAFAGLGISNSQMDYAVWNSSANHVFYQGTTELMRINGTGNVGIGTTTPTSRLSVNGNIDYGNRKLKFIGESNDGTARWVKFMTFSITNAWDTDRYEYYIKSRWYAGTLRFNLGSSATADSNYVDFFEFKKDYDFDNNVRFVYYKSSSTTYDVYIYLNSYTDASYAELFENNGGMGHSIGSTTFAGTYSDPPVGYVEASYPSPTGSYWSANGTSIFNNNGGAVGIGVTNPASLFQLSYSDAASTTAIMSGATILNYASVSGLYAGIRFSTYGDPNGGNYPKQFIGTVRNAAGSGLGDLVFLNRNAADNSVVLPTDERMRITYTGNVGIGTTNPNTKLYVAGTSLNTLATTHSLLGGAGNVVVMADNTGALYATSTASLVSGGTSLWSGTLDGNIWNGSAGAGFVGLGTTNPVQKLTLGGGTDRLYFASSTSGTKIVMNNSGPNNYMNIGAYASVTNSRIGFGYNTDPNSNTITEVMSVVDSGNVGIGTTSPIAKLDIAGSTTVGTAILNVGGNDLSGDAMRVVSTGPSGTTYTAGSSAVLNVGGVGATPSIRTRGGAIFAETYGNVGIGTTTPAAKLQVNGNAIFGQNIDSATANPINVSFGGTYGNSVPGSKANLKWDMYNGGNNSYRYGIGMSYNLMEFQAGTNGGFGFYPNGGTSSALTILGGGNVGIGTTNPTTKLYVAGTSLNTLATTHSLLGGAGNVVVMADNTGALYATSTASLVSGGTSLWSGTLDGNIWNGTAGSGNVGIGTTSPGGKLDVQDNVTSPITGLANSATIKLRNTNWAEGTTGTGFIEHANDSLLLGETRVSSGHIGFYTNDGVSLGERLTIISSGNVGIGTTAPSQKLTLTGAASAPSLTHDSSALFSIYPTSVGTDLVFGAISGTPYTAWIQNRHKTVDGMSYPIALNPLGGNVGIGTTAPGARLSVNGAANGVGSNISTQGDVMIGAATGASIFFDGNYSYAAGNYIRAVATNTQAFFTTGAERMRIAAGGNVGVGQTNPTVKLDVSGTFRNTLATTHSLLGGGGEVLVMADNSGNLYATSTAGFIGGSGSYLPLTGGSLSGALNMGGNNITNINKLTVNTIDPLYNIQGVNYSTFASSIAGGVKEEYIGRAKINNLTSDGEREYVVDFDKQPVGSDLWVWRKTVDFSSDNVEILTTPYGSFAQVYYKIEGNKIIFRADRATEISYRLSGRRVDWMKWPTKALDQTEKAGFVIE
jgi:hypothetical protein